MYSPRAAEAAAFQFGTIPGVRLGRIRTGNRAPAVSSLMMSSVPSVEPLSETNNSQGEHVCASALEIAWRI